MTSMITRLLVATGLVVTICGGLFLIPSGPNPSTVKLPDRSFHKMPLAFDSWQGEEAELDPRIFERLGAKIALDRIYRDHAGSTVSVHTAIFTDYSLGAFHRPDNCYRSSGWKLVNEERLELQNTGQPSVSVQMSTWKRNTAQVVVLYWYQLGEHVILDRHDLGVARWALMGSDTWPPLVKVLMQTPGDNLGQGRTRIQELAGHVYKWINQPNLDGTDQ